MRPIDTPSDWVGEMFPGHGFDIVDADELIRANEIILLHSVRWGEEPFTIEPEHDGIKTNRAWLRTRLHRWWHANRPEQAAAAAQINGEEQS